MDERDPKQPEGASKTLDEIRDLAGIAATARAGAEQVKVGQEAAGDYNPSQQPYPASTENRVGRFPSGYLEGDNHATLPAAD